MLIQFLRIQLEEINKRVKMRDEQAWGMTLGQKLKRTYTTYNKPSWLYKYTVHVLRIQIVWGVTLSPSMSDF
jgi:hypothetical protein